MLRRRRRLSSASPVRRRHAQQRRRRRLRRPCGRGDRRRSASTSVASAGSGGTHGGGHRRARGRRSRAGVPCLASPPSTKRASVSRATPSAPSSPFRRAIPRLPPSPPFHRPWPKNAGSAIELACPTLLVFGERDKVAPASKLEGAGLDLPPESRVVTLPADHFWWGHEQEAAAKVAEFFQEHTESK